MTTLCNQRVLKLHDGSEELFIPVSFMIPTHCIIQAQELQMSLSMKSSMSNSNKTESKGGGWLEGKTQITIELERV